MNGSKIATTDNQLNKNLIPLSTLFNLFLPPIRRVTAHGFPPILSLFMAHGPDRVGIPFFHFFLAFFQKGRYDVIIIYNV